MAKKKYQKFDDLRKLPENSKRRPASAESKRLFALTLVNTVALMLIYFYLVQELEIIAVMFVYMGLTAGFSIAFVIYNRGLPQAKIDTDSLPFNWSAEQKRSYIEDRTMRLKKSRWMITIILPLFVTLCADFIMIQTIPYFKEIFFG